LVKFGGHCNAYEDPPEYLMQGDHGQNGICLQTDVKGDFSKHIRGSLRRYTIMHNSILFIGEIRDEATARQALLASTQGHLVISTIHARSLEATFKKLVSWASGGDQANKENAADILSSTFRFCFHQKKIFNPNAKGWKIFNITGDVLYSLTEEQQELLKSNIKNSDFEKFKDLINRQKTAIRKYGSGEITKDDLFKQA
jgi:Tfp pilus assembly pilus retraction ATPase PilT